MIRTEVSLSTVRVGYLPAKDVVADSNIIGREFTFEAVLGPTAIAVAGDFVSVEGHGSTLVDHLPVEQGTLAPLGPHVPLDEAHRPAPD